MELLSYIIIRPTIAGTDTGTKVELGVTDRNRNWNRDRTGQRLRSLIPLDHIIDMDYTEYNNHRIRILMIFVRVIIMYVGR